MRLSTLLTVVICSQLPTGLHHTNVDFNQGPFPGLRVPFFARVRFKQLPTIEKSAKTHRVGPSRVWGVFFGWSVEPGGKWTGRYNCAALTEFIGMDLRVGGHVRIQEVCEVDFDPNEVFFPLKRIICS